VNVVFTAFCVLKLVKQEQQLYKAILHHTITYWYKQKFIIIVFHLQQLGAVAQRETLHVFVTLPSHLSPFVGCLFQFEFTFNWLVPDLPQFPFFVILIVHTVCNLPVWLAHYCNPNISPSTWTKLSPWKRRQYIHAVSEQIY